MTKWISFADSDLCCLHTCSSTASSSHCRLKKVSVSFLGLDLTEVFTASCWRSERERSTRATRGNSFKKLQTQEALLGSGAFSLILSLKQVLAAGKCFLVTFYATFSEYESEKSSACALRSSNFQQVNSGAGLSVFLKNFDTHSGIFVAELIIFISV